MNFFLLIAIPLLGYSLYNYHRAFLWYFLFRIFLSNFVPFVAIAGLPQIRMSLVCDSWFLMLIVLNYVVKNGLFEIPVVPPVFRSFLYLIIMKNLVALGHSYGKKLIFFFVIGWLVVSSASSTPGLDVSLFFMMMFCIAKLDENLLD